LHASAALVRSCAPHVLCAQEVVRALKRGALRAQHAQRCGSLGARDVVRFALRSETRNATC
jgi:hypothetical protein